MNKRELHIDLETYCEEDLRVCGLYRYVEHPSFEILLFSYAYDNDEPTRLDLTKDDFRGESIPSSVIKDLKDPNVVKIAHNAPFEIACLKSYLRLSLSTSQWVCTMVRAAYFGLPMKLEEVAKVLGLEQQKDTKGKTLINYFSKPCKPSKVNGGRTRNLPEHAPDKWADFGIYVDQDVRTEQGVWNYLKRFDYPESEANLWTVDHFINSLGISIDQDFINAAISVDNSFNELATKEAKRLTELENPNSLQQLKAWITDNTGIEVTSLAKDDVSFLIESWKLPKKVKRVLELRQLMSKTSTKKYTAMLNGVCRDGRVRGLVQFYGASTGRWAGRLVQVQNLPRNYEEDLETAREIIKLGIDTANECYENIPDILSQLIRTAFVAPKGFTFAVSDFSAIEARVIAWLAGEQWRLDVFNTHGKIYEASAAAMFGVPISMVTKGSDLRAKGKIAELALGYQGASGALQQMDRNKSLNVEELPGLVSAWRTSNPAIVKLWKKVENAAKYVAKEKRPYSLVLPYTKLKFTYERGYLFIELPSGRKLAYRDIHLTSDGKLAFWGVNSTTKKWERVYTYGGKLVENIVQAIARDCLGNILYKLYAKGYRVVMHVHDEIIAEVLIEDAKDALKDISAIMAISPNWAKDLPLKGDGYITQFYKKD
jgi:DNA polymerase